MKYAVMFFLMSFIFLFTVSCGKNKKCVKKNQSDSVIEDDRCTDFHYKAIRNGRKIGVCYDGPLLKGRDARAIDPDPEACKALLAEAQKKCDALPPDPKFQKPVSRTEIYKDGELVSVNGEPVSKGLPDCDECKDCEPID